MRYQLAALDLAGLDLALGPHQVVIAAARGVRGQLDVSSPSRWEASALAVDQLSASRLELALGPVRLRSTTALEVAALAGNVGNSPSVHGELTAQTLGLRTLTLEIGELVLEAGLELEGCRVRIDGGDGVVLAERATLTTFALTAPGRTARVARLVVTELVVAWGTEGLRIEAGTVDIDGIEAGLELGTEPSEPRAPYSLARDVLALADRITGELNVDLALDLTVPVLGRRRATHRFRIPISRGTVDYLRLEQDLSTLENALLDFSLRDSTLVLEMGIPFIPTRGLGKPLLRWQLDVPDLALARDNRIRISRLIAFELAAGGDGSQPASVALRQLELRGLAAELRLEDGPAPAALPLERLVSSVQGDVYHDLDTAPRAGQVRLRVSELVLGALAHGPVSCARASITRPVDAVLGFVGARPTSVRAALPSLSIARLRFTG